MNRSKKPQYKEQFIQSLVAAVLVWLPAGRVEGQTFRTLHNFAQYLPNGLYGYEPVGLLLSDNILYGTTRWGGNPSGGAVFKLNADGTGFKALYMLSVLSEGANPSSSPVLSGSVLYGTLPFGGGSDEGTVFSINTDGTGFSVLQSFTAVDCSSGLCINSEGGGPSGPLVLSGNTLYGEANSGGSGGSGTLFSLNTDGTGFKALYSFTPAPGSPRYNSDGAVPGAGLIFASNVLYGTTHWGGVGGFGTVFAINTDGTTFTTLYSFTAPTKNSYGLYTNSDGFDCQAPLVLSGKALYGVASGGGTSGNGTVFAINADGTGFHTLHTFSAFDGSENSGLVISGDTLYGISSGSVFMLKTNGTGFTTLYSFTPLSGSPFNETNSDGACPTSLILSGNTLYGTTRLGGSGGGGTVFSIVLPLPQLTIAVSGANVVLSWPTNFAGFDYSGYTLQSTTNLAPSAVWVTNSTPPVVINGLNTVTNPITGLQQFYRLAQ